MVRSSLAISCSHDDIFHIDAPLLALCRRQSSSEGHNFDRVAMYHNVLRSRSNVAIRLRSNMWSNNVINARRFSNGELRSPLSKIRVTRRRFCLSVWRNSRVVFEIPVTRRTSFPGFNRIVYRYEMDWNWSTEERAVETL